MLQVGVNLTTKLIKYSTRTMCSIGSYIFFDIETTGLPYVDLGNTKITEFTLIAVAKDHFSNDKLEVPRILNTLTLCVNPLGHIGLAASKITGLTNEQLDVMGPFDEDVCKMISTFIDRLPQPACLLAHNGDRFDFPILQSHILSLNMTLPENLLCGDTLKGFRYLNVMERDPSDWKLQCNKSIEEVIDKVGTTLSSTSIAIDEIELNCSSNPDKHLLFDNNDHLFAQIKEPEMLCDDNDHLFTQIDEVEILSQQGYSTPDKPICTQVRTPIKKARNDVRTEVTPPSVKRKLYTSSSPSYKLQSVHKHVTGNDISNAHSSYSDSLAMLSIVSSIGQPFHDWLQENSVLFNSIKKMW